MIFDLTGPVDFNDEIKSDSGNSTLTVYLKGVTPDAKLDRHMVFDKSIFRDCDVETDSTGTKVTMNTTPVARFAVVPLENPARLLVTFTPQGGIPGATIPATASDNGMPDMPAPSDSDSNTSQ